MRARRAAPRRSWPVLRRGGRHRAGARSPASPNVPAAHAAGQRPPPPPSTAAGRPTSVWPWTCGPPRRRPAGLDVNYTPSGSPQGLALFRDRSIDYAGTEAEFSSLGIGSDDAVARGFQYVPDVAGAVAIMYNAQDEAGRHVDYLRLSRSTVAKIFMGYITHWDDPQITNDLGGQIRLPHQPITVVYRSSPSGTTALFYDFVQNTEPELFAQWAAAHNLSTDQPHHRADARRTSPRAPTGRARPTRSRQFVARTPWSIGYDEFGYAQVYGNDVAWIQNAAGLVGQAVRRQHHRRARDRHLRPDLSQDLRNVYASPNPGAYPISAYSYMVTQCAAAGDRPTCKGNYPNTGVSRDARRLHALRGVRGPDPDGRHRLLAPPAAALAVHRRRHRAHVGPRRRDADTARTAPTHASTPTTCFPAASSRRPSPIRQGWRTSAPPAARGPATTGRRRDGHDRAGAAAETAAAGRAGRRGGRRRWVRRLARRRPRGVRPAGHGPHRAVAAARGPPRPAPAGGRRHDLPHRPAGPAPARGAGASPPPPPPPEPDLRPATIGPPLFAPHGVAGVRALTKTDESRRRRRGRR